MELSNDTKDQKNINGFSQIAPHFNTIIHQYRDYAAQLHNLSEQHRFLRADTVDWTLVDVDRDGTRYFRLRENVNCIRMTTTVSCSPVDLFHLLINTQLRREWDHNLKDIEIIKPLGSNDTSETLYLKYAAPFMGSWCRDCAQVQQGHIDENGFMYIMFKDVDIEERPVSSSFVRMQRSGCFIISPSDTNRCLFSLIADVNYAGWLPMPLHFELVGVFLRQTKMGVDSYVEYLKGIGKRIERIQVGKGKRSSQKLPMYTWDELQHADLDTFEFYDFPYGDILQEKMDTVRNIEDISSDWRVASENSGVVTRMMMSETGKVPTLIAKGVINIHPYVVKEYLVDLGNKNEWDPNAKGVEVVEPYSIKCALTREWYNPVPFTAPREVLYIATYREMVKDNYLVLGFSVDRPDIAPRNKHFGGWILRLNEDGGTDVAYVAKIDYGGNVPKYLLNKGIVKQPEQSILGLRRALENKHQYINEKMEEYNNLQAEQEDGNITESE